MQAGEGRAELAEEGEAPEARGGRVWRVEAYPSVWEARGRAELREGVGAAQVGAGEERLGAGSSAPLTGKGALRIQG